MQLPDFHIDHNWVHDLRGDKNTIDPAKPYAWITEKERMPNGEVAQVATVFLTNRECPFHCLMCDLWKNTTDSTVDARMIVRQLAYALERLPATRHIKLYNSGNFFDKRAIPRAAYEGIIGLLHGFESIIIENHPKLVGREVLDFRDRMGTEVQVAMGLETVHPQVLPLLNKNMTLADFEKAVKYLKIHDLPSRAFILLRPPFLDEKEGVAWACRSLDYAFDIGVECCAVIPTRAGNGALDRLAQAGLFQEPVIDSLEQVLAYGLNLHQGRVFADLWDLEHFSGCNQCIDQRKTRLHQMNLQQAVLPAVACDHCQ